MGFPLTTYSETRARGVAGSRKPQEGDRIRAGFNKESTAAMPFGRFVCYERSTDDFGMLCPDATTDKLAGVVLQSYDYASEQIGLGSTSPGDAAIGVLPTNKVNVLRQGYVLCVCDAGQTPLPGDPVFVRAVAGAGEVEGSVRTAADSTDCIDLTGQASFDSAPFTAAGGELVAWVYVNLAGK